MKALTTLISNQSDVCSEISDLRSSYDVIEKAIEASGVDDLLSVLDVLMTTNAWLQRFFRAESQYLAELKNTGEKVLLRTDEDTIDRLAELHSIYCHYDVCLTVVNRYKTKELESIAEVLSGSVAHLNCLHYEQQLKLNIKQEAA